MLKAKRFEHMYRPAQGKLNDLGGARVEGLDGGRLEWLEKDRLMEVERRRIEKDLEAIAAFNMTPGEGISRLTFTEEYEKGRSYLISELERVGAEVSITVGGNLRARLPGRSSEKPAVMMGSHLDSVLHGGRFDGIVGVASALEVARVIAENDVVHDCPIDLVVFAEEEGGRFGSVMVGSLAWTGKLSLADLRALRDKDGLSYLEAMERAGIRPNDESVLRPGMVKAMLEPHIEQSIVLEKKGYEIGIVEAIAGIRGFLVTIDGIANHAGATPMNIRADALQGAVRVIGATEAIARSSSKDAVATVGLVRCEPGVANVIPGRACFTLDIRDRDARLLDRAVDEVMEELRKTCEERGLRWEVEDRSNVAPMLLSEEVANVLERKAFERGIEPLRMVSGALHDSAALAEMTDVGMIFIPSKEGRSHCPEEFSELNHIKKAADILLDAVVELSNR